MSTKLRNVLDANVIISGLINAHGLPGKILEALRNREFILVSSQPINEEVLEVMDRPHLRDKYDLAEHLFDIAFILWKNADVVANLPVLKVSKDPDDNKFLSTALGGLAHYLVTGDIKGLLDLQEYNGIGIVTPKQFLTILNKQG